MSDWLDLRLGSPIDRGVGHSLAELGGTGGSFFASVDVRCLPVCAKEIFFFFQLFVLFHLLTPSSAGARGWLPVPFTAADVGILLCPMSPGNGEGGGPMLPWAVSIVIRLSSSGITRYERPNALDPSDNGVTLWTYEFRPLRIEAVGNSMGPEDPVCGIMLPGNEPVCIQEESCNLSIDLWEGT